MSSVSRAIFCWRSGVEVLERAHVVQAVGELDEDDADVVDHGQHHLAQVFGLLLFAGGEIDLADLGDALDDVRDLLAEFLADFDDGDRGVFDGIVQQAGGDGDRIHLHVGQNVARLRADGRGRVRRRRGSVRRDASGKIRRLS